jgi:hypothetical protein
MLENMIIYSNKLKKLIDDNPVNTNWQKELEFFETKLLHLQLERFIHLIVTMTVGIALLIVSYMSLLFLTLPLFILDGILMILFFAYILHYRKLENTTQTLYPLLDALKKKI